MGSTVFAFLSESFLFRDEDRADGYASFTDAEIQAELLRYREHVVSELSSLKKEISASDGHLKFLAERDRFSTRRLMQSALYLDQVTLPDPLFPLTRQESQSTRTMNRFHNLQDQDAVDREALAATTSRMKSLTPMVAANYVKYFPLSYLSEPGEEVPLTYSETGFADILPPEILKQYRESADVRSLRKTERGFVVEDALSRGRRIAVGFRGHYGERMMLFELFRRRNISVDDDAGIVRVVMDLPDDPPSQEEFLWWVMQSVHQTARDHCQETGSLLSLAQECDSSLLTGSEFTYSLLRANGSQRSAAEYTTDCLFGLDLPYIDGISMADLMHVRQNEGEAFHRFRAELERRLRELRREGHPSAVHSKMDDIMHEFAVVNSAEIEQELSRIKKSLPIAVLIGGLSERS